MAVMITAAVAGASGYAGGEVLRLLLGHPDINIGPVAAESSAGASVAQLHPHLPQLADRRFAPMDADTLATADVVFFALPHGASAALARALPATLPIVDLGADHRLADADAWTGYYPGQWAGTWTYGLPELPGARGRIAESLRVANPGCYPTGVILGLSPLLAADLVEPDDIVVVAASGTTGAGRKPSGALLASEIVGSMAAYKAGGTHQHTPEIEQALGWAAQAPVTVSFTPTLAPMPRGILATTTARLAPGVGTDQLRDVLHDAYAGEQFVYIAAEGTWPASGWTLGSNSVLIQAAADAHSGRAVVVTAIDNLVKGAAGQAIQNVNLMLGLDEAAGLTSTGVAP
ncbi:MAG: N-acetyl-gamma-glutamyl-phosphate reductase [Actinomycetota bacterium]|nr:N-acetyl-gamma-glutamyl-phosphate reductase [Actinomycetota bacterium]